MKWKYILFDIKLINLLYMSMMLNTRKEKESVGLRKIYMFSHNLSPIDYQIPEISHMDKPSM